MEPKQRVTLTPVPNEDRSEFCRNLQRAFGKAVEELSGPLTEPIPPDGDVWRSMDAPGAASYHILWEGKKAGGIVVNIDRKTRRNHLDFFFIAPEYHSRGLGLAAWQAMEALYPETEVWETGTPYFEKRNIHFYVNKCGFHIVKFFSRYYPDPNETEEGDAEELPGGDGFFVFEKVMGK